MRYCSCWLLKTNLYPLQSPCCLQSKCHLFTPSKAVSNSVYLNLVLTNCPNETSIYSCKFILFLSVAKCILSYIIYWTLWNLFNNSGISNWDIGKSSQLFVLWFLFVHIKRAVWFKHPNMCKNLVHFMLSGLHICFLGCFSSKDSLNFCVKYLRALTSNFVHSESH